ncbi:hypothetical protein TREMEDRAFT_64344 [Tremella mesenterica DSM 1558]|uniref:uncharacterized protein n=1 Tax=Tremella mesenterica (strain ATCC 24925 / CBS 8224 / DSM 1558 / NBRC 9311 / NRRL Y-6157 / RJB 2259-6 / UBC 559-6) TaxID=578456 RepID=UPI0003F48F59|nr:uncharacterized protein TREMEDRAFT_64344 [Tremella mesenterica DSM 1558]EIW67752.1 hypothetical protein TREMEDRAFT_64344 [Tremella mesenterica DSM 1558]
MASTETTKPTLEAQLRDEFFAYTEEWGDYSSSECEQLWDRAMALAQDLRFSVSLGARRKKTVSEAERKGPPRLKVEAQMTKVLKQEEGGNYDKSSNWPCLSNNYTNVSANDLRPSLLALADDGSSKIGWDGLLSAANSLLSATTKIAGHRHIPNHESALESQAGAMALLHRSLPYIHVVNATPEDLCVQILNVLEDLAQSSKARDCLVEIYRVSASSSNVTVTKKKSSLRKEMTALISDQGVESEIWTRGLSLARARSSRGETMSPNLQEKAVLEVLMRVMTSMIYVVLQEGMDKKTLFRRSTQLMKTVERQLIDTDNTWPRLKSTDVEIKGNNLVLSFRVLLDSHLAEGISNDETVRQAEAIFQSIDDISKHPILRQVESKFDNHARATMLLSYTAFSPSTSIRTGVFSDAFDYTRTMTLNCLDCFSSLRESVCCIEASTLLDLCELVHAVAESPSMIGAYALLRERKAIPLPEVIVKAPSSDGGVNGPQSSPTSVNPAYLSAQWESTRITSRMNGPDLSPYNPDSSFNEKFSKLEVKEERRLPVDLGWLSTIFGGVSVVSNLYDQALRISEINPTSPEGNEWTPYEIVRRLAKYLVTAGTYAAARFNLDISQLHETTKRVIPLIDDPSWYAMPDHKTGSIIAAKAFEIHFSAEPRQNMPQSVSWILEASQEISQDVFFLGEDGNLKAAILMCDMTIWTKDGNDKMSVHSAIHKAQCNTIDALELLNSPDCDRSLPDATETIMLAKWDFGENSREIDSFTQLRADVLAAAHANRDYQRMSTFKFPEYSVPELSTSNGSRSVSSVGTPDYTRPDSAMSGDRPPEVIVAGARIVCPKPIPASGNAGPFEIMISNTE